MRDPNADPNNIQMKDVWCDFCRRSWTDELPMIEGHQGSIVCGNCLTVAYRAVVLDGSATAPAGSKCAMCLEHRDDPAWQSPAYPEAVICRRCIKQAAGALHKDKAYDWSKPVGETGEGAQQR